MKRIHIIGRKNSGKTTLVVELVTALTARGHRVGTIKHTHHDHELDTPGKDSYRHREAGSSAVGILSRGMNAVFWPADRNPAPADKYAQFEAMMSVCDIVLVEGDSQTSSPKLEVFRAANTDAPIAAQDPSVLAVVTDDQPDVMQPTLKRSDLESIIAFIESQTD